MRGWAVLRKWNSEDFDKNDLIRRLQVKYGVFPYFKISIEPNPYKPGFNIITISPSGLGLPDRNYYYDSENIVYQTAYKEFIRDTVLSLAVTEVSAEKFGEDMFHYEKRIAEITPQSIDLLNPINTYNSVRISELKVTAASLPIEELLTAMFPESQISEETEVIVTSGDYLTQVSNIISSTDRETINNYFLWTLVRKYVPYLSTRFTSTWFTFNSKLFGMKKDTQRWEKCTKLVHKVMGLAIESTFVTESPINKKNKIIVENIFNKVVNTAKDSLRNYRISSELHKYLTYKLSKLNIQIGLPNINETFLKAYYNKLNILKTDFVTSIQNSIVFQQKVKESMLSSQDFQLNLIELMINYPQEVMYLPSLNTITIPKILLTEDEFEIGYPSSILYGKLGIKIANAVISSILPYDSAWNADLKLLSRFHFTVNESCESVADAKQCLADFIRDQNMLSEDISKITSLSTLKHVSGVRLAHEALNQHLLEEPHIHQPSLEIYEDSAVFFLTYAQDQCSYSTTQQQFFDNMVKHELSKAALLQASWSHLPEFSTSLDCKSNAHRCSDIF